MRPCEIVEVGKRRDGGYRYWCIAHRANATAKYGKRADHCVAADDPAILDEEIFQFDPAKYPGGIALWGAVPAVYDTTILPVDRGIHVHARTEVGGKKVIDKTYRGLTLIAPKDLLGTEKLRVDELDAIYFMVSNVFEKPMKYLTCTLCGFPHLDRDWFSVHKHKRHLCHGCGRNFSDVEEGIGNPAIKLQQVLGSAGPQAQVPAPQQLDIKQQDYPGGIQIWGSNPAIVWTATKREEEGIHVHGYRDDHSDPTFDGTFHSVSIDGIKLDADMVRYFMVQSAMPHIRERVIYLQCPSCGGEHFDRGELGYVLHEEHHCEHCGGLFKAPTRIKKTIGNPFTKTREQLARFALRTPQRPFLDLRSETI